MSNLDKFVDQKTGHPAERVAAQNLPVNTITPRPDLKSSGPRKSQIDVRHTSYAQATRGYGGQVPESVRAQHATSSKGPLTLPPQPGPQDPSKQVGAIDLHNERFACTLDGPSNDHGKRGLLARWEMIPPKRPSSKLMLQHLPAATPEFAKFDYLQPQPEDQQRNYYPTSDLRQTRFHRGFQRKHVTDIRQDAPRMQAEMEVDRKRTLRDNQIIEDWGEYKKDYTFNLLTGEGSGRDGEFKSIGKRILNPSHTYHNYPEHQTDSRNRLRQSLHRFDEYPPPMASRNREAQQASEGFLGSQKETMIIGYPAGGQGAPRVKMRSQGVSDNFKHLQDGKPQTDFEKARDKNKSQIVFG